MQNLLKGLLQKWHTFQSHDIMIQGQHLLNDLQKYQQQSLYKM